MSAAVIVSGVAEALTLLDNLVQASGKVSAAIKASQSTGQPLDMTQVLSDVNVAENAVLAAIAAAQARGA